MLEFLRLMWVGTVEAMRLNPRTFEFVSATSWSGWVILAVAIVGGASLLLGQSVILFLNRVSPGRFALSLVLNGVTFTLSLAVWALAIWATWRLFFPDPLPFRRVLQMVGLGAAPYVFGFLVLLPYAGSFIGKLLSVWSFLVVLAALTNVSGVNIFAVLICTALGWLLMSVLSATIGRPLVAAYRRLWKWLTGADLDLSVHEAMSRAMADEIHGAMRPTDGEER